MDLIGSLPPQANDLLRRNRSAFERFAGHTVEALNQRLPPVTRDEMERATQQGPENAAMLAQDTPLFPIRSPGTESLRDTILAELRRLGIQRVRFLTIRELTSHDSPYRHGPDGDQLWLGCALGGRTQFRWHVEARVPFNKFLERTQRETDEPIIVPLTRWCDQLTNRLIAPFVWRPICANGLVVCQNGIEEAIRGAFRVGFAYPLILALIGQEQEAETLTNAGMIIPNCIPLYVDGTGTELTVLVRD